MPKNIAQIQCLCVVDDIIIQCFGRLHIPVLYGRLSRFTVLFVYIIF